jgi:hypothetical protein
MSTKRTLSVRQAAQRFGVTEADIKEALREGALPAAFSPKWGVSEADVLLWLLRSKRISFEEFQAKVR